MADLLLNLLARDSASAAFGNFAGAVVGAERAFVGMMKAGADAERVERQLKAVAGDLTESFKKQATAISEQLAVEDELVMSMQTMLLRFGAAPAAIDGATRAVLDYAALNGGDALSATNALIKGVQNGTGSIKALGVQYEVTGNFTKDLANATEALAKRFGGAAETEADTIAGSARKAKVAMGELQETFGGLVNDFITKTGAVDAITFSLKALQDAFKDKDTWEKRGELVKKRGELVKELEGLKKVGDSFDAAGHSRIAETQARVDAINAEIAALEKLGQTEAKVAQKGAAGLQSNAPLPGFENKVKGGKSASDLADEALNFKIAMAQHDQQRREQQHAEDTFELEEELRQKQARDKYEKEVDDHIARVAKAEQDALIRQQEHQKKDFDEYKAASIKAAQEFDRQQQETFDRQADMWINAGMDIGRAIIDGITTAMRKGEGGKDGGSAAIIKTIYSVFYTVIKTVVSALGYGGAFSMFEGGVGLIDAGTNAATGTESSGTDFMSGGFHTGGWPVERAHTGKWMPGEVPALLQEGERVLSRSEVASMGGRGGVERAVRGGGGGGNNYYISALDSLSFGDYLGGRGGRAMFNKLRTGGGPLPSVLGRV